jgi:hypothetical protein
MVWRLGLATRLSPSRDGAPALRGRRRPRLAVRSWAAAVIFASEPSLLAQVSRPRAVHTRRQAALYGVGRNTAETGVWLPARGPGAAQQREAFCGLSPEPRVHGQPRQDAGIRAAAPAAWAISRERVKAAWLSSIRPWASQQTATYPAALPFGLLQPPRRPRHPQQHPTFPPPCGRPLRELHAHSPSCVHCSAKWTRWRCSWRGSYRHPCRPLPAAVPVEVAVLIGTAG